MKQIINIILLFSFFGVSSQIDTTEAILGEWSIKAYKSSPILLGWDEEIESKVILKSDSLLKLKITKDSIYIHRDRSYGVNDSFAYSYHFKEDTSRYSSKGIQLIITPSKKELRRFRKGLRKLFTQISFTITKLNNSQLNIETFATDNYPINPFFNMSIKEYSFQKTPIDTIINQLTQNTGWFAQFDNSNILETDTITLYKDSLKTNGLRHYHFIFSENHFKENVLKINDITPQFGVSGFYIFSNQTWFLGKNQIVIVSQGKKTTYSYKFIDKNIVLIKNGS